MFRTPKDHSDHPRPTPTHPRPFQTTFQPLLDHPDQPRPLFRKNSVKLLSSSEPFGSLIENDVQSKVDDGVILKLEEHDDAVYR